MKKLISVLIIISTFAIMSTNIYANTSVNIEKAQQSSTGEVNIECSITNPNSTQNITVLSCEMGDKTYSKEIINIDQFTADISSDNKFTFNFMPSWWVDTNKVYIVRVGGDSIDTPDSMIIAFYDGKVYKAGDIDGNGDINKTDAALLIKYLSGSLKLNSRQMAAADVNSDTNVDLTDAIKIVDISSKVRID